MSSTRDERRADLINRYLVGIGMGGIFVVGKPDEPPRLMVVTDLAGTVREIEKQEDLLVLRRVWFSNAGVATRVYQRALELISVADTVDAQRERVDTAADMVGAEPKDDQVVTAQCSSAVAEIEQVIDRERTSGGLKDVNRAYKQHRIEMGKSAFPYEEWLHQYKIKAVEAAAHRLRSVLRSSMV